MEWLQKRTPLEKTLLSLSSLLLLSLLLMILFGIAFTGKSCKSSPDDLEGCWTTECIELAGDILSSMDPQVDSCSDFYNLACGGYSSMSSPASSVPKEAVDSAYFGLKNLIESTETSQVKGFDDLKSFYNSCVQFEGYRPKSGVTGSHLLELMQKLGIGVWPLLDPLYDTSAFSLEHALVSLVLLEVPVVFRLEVVLVEDGPHLIKISPGGPHETGRSPSDIRGDAHLRSRVLSSLLLLGVSAANTNNDVADLLAVDSSFAAIEQDASFPCEQNLFSPDEAVSELNRVIPEINWAYVLAEVRRSTGLLRATFGVQLFCKHKIREYVVHLNDLSIRSETSYLGWRFFSKFVEHIIPTFDAFRQAEPLPRWRTCMQLLERFATPVLARALTAKMVAKDVHKEVDRIANTTLTTARQLLSTASWLDEQQREEIGKKVALLRVLSPFDSSRDGGDVQLPAEVLQVDVANFTSAVVHLERQWVIRRFKQLSQDEISTGSPWTPLISPGEDSGDFVVPLYFDQIQSPFLRKSASPWMNFGGFGVSVARQISQAILSLTVGEEDGPHLLSAWIGAKSSSTCLLRSLADRNGIQVESLPQPVIDDLVRHLFVERSAIEIAFESAKSSAGLSGSLPGLDWSEHKMFFLTQTQSVCSVDQISKRKTNISDIRNRLNSMLSSYQPFTDAFSCSSSSKCLIWV